MPATFSTVVFADIELDALTSPQIETVMKNLRYEKPAGCDHIPPSCTNVFATT